MFDQRFHECVGLFPIDMANLGELVTDFIRGLVAGQIFGQWFLEGHLGNASVVVKKSIGRLVHALGSRRQQVRQGCLGIDDDVQTLRGAARAYRKTRSRIWRPKRQGYRGRRDLRRWHNYRLRGRHRNSLLGFLGSDDIHCDKSDTQEQQAGREDFDDLDVTHDVSPLEEVGSNRTSSSPWAAQL